MKIRVGAWTWVVVAMLVAGSRAHEIINLSKCGAKADGKSDDREVILKAFADACKATGDSKIVIPRGEYYVSPLTLKGPCTAAVTIEAAGATLLAPPQVNQFKNQTNWFIFQEIDKLSVIGGTFDGQGQATWDEYSAEEEKCLKYDNCPSIPMNIIINGVKNALFKDVTSKDSKNFHINCTLSSNVTFKGMMVRAPHDSPNTDGIHITRSTDIKILDSIIETGDDCISMGDGLSNVLIQGTKCGPGHGISIGALGKDPEEKNINGITVEKCIFFNSKNGVRIKTWPSAPATLNITNLKFSELTMINASNPVIFNQQYCPKNLCNLFRPSLIQISKVKISDVKGTSGTKDVMTFECSGARPCEEVEIGNVDLKFTGEGEAAIKCENLKHTSAGKQDPPLCVKADYTPAAQAPMQEL